MLDALESGTPITSDDLAFSRIHAARRIEAGLPMKDFLHAFQVGHRVMWEVARATLPTDPEGQEAAIVIASRLIQFFNVSSTNAAESYLEARQLLLAEHDRHGRDLLEDLLAGREPAPGPRLDRARSAGLSADAQLVVVVASAPVHQHESDDEFALRSAAASIAHAVSGMSPPLAVVRREEIAVVTALRPSAVSDRVTALAHTCTVLQDKGLNLRIGVSTVHQGWGAVRDAYREARDAMERTDAEGGLVALPGLSALAYLTNNRDETAARLVDPAIREFIEADTAGDGVLVATLLAYVDSDMNVTATAASLNIHLNTARYRLARIAERTGRDLRRLPDVMELVVGVRLARHPPV
jgi:sugar diacid utilization regulator